MFLFSSFLYFGTGMPVSKFDVSVNDAGAGGAQFVIGFWPVDLCLF